MKIIFLSALILTGCYGPSSNGIANAESTKSFSSPGSYPLQLFAGYGSAIVCSNQNDNYKCWRSNNSDKWTQITSANPLSKNGYSAFYASSDGSMLCGQKAGLTRCFPDVLNYDFLYQQGARNTKFIITASPAKTGPEYFKIGAQGNPDDIQVTSPTYIESEIFYSIASRGSVPFYEFETDLSDLHINDKTGQILGHLYADKLLRHTSTSVYGTFNNLFQYNLTVFDFNPSSPAYLNYVTEGVTSFKWPFYFKGGNIYRLLESQYPSNDPDILQQQSVDSFDVLGNEANGSQILIFTRSGKRFLSVGPLQSEELNFIPSTWSHLQIFPYDARGRAPEGAPFSSTLVYCGIDVSGKPNCLGPKLTRTADGKFKTDFITVDVPQLPFPLLNLKSYADVICGFGTQKYTCWGYGKETAGSTPDEFTLGDLQFAPGAGPDEVYYEFDPSFRLCQGDLKVTENGFNYFFRLEKDLLRISKCTTAGSLDRSYGEIRLVMKYDPKIGSIFVRHQAEGNTHWIYMPINATQTFVLVKLGSDFRPDLSFSGDGIQEFALNRSVSVTDAKIETVGSVYKAHLVTGSYQPNLKLIIDAAGNLIDISNE